MTVATIAALLWDNRRIMAGAAGIGALAGLIWWFGFQVPAQRDRLRIENKTLQEQVAAGQAAITLQEDIQHGRQAIEAATQHRISSLRAQPKPVRHGVLVPGGRLSDLPTLYPAHVAH
ncbi:hypothetical protein FO488_05095 [Geobacter sp. FeAm09]|uniref:hypothetical protein n=1 Tax=Geobacter sp. FeAm09 TaxID=2597769 RepID=UPI0011EE4A18|nr:hypothetical protein [Geobacter sp. FeAm09]QEM67589.1 hypothetical protein FO488_05095 [Geobacter sp. FeAm09]